MKIQTNLCKLKQIFAKISKYYGCWASSSWLFAGHFVVIFRVRQSGMWCSVGGNVKMVKLFCTCHNDTEWTGGTAPLIVNLGSRWRWVVNVMLPPTYHQKRTLIPIEYEVGCIPGPVWMCLEMGKISEQDMNPGLCSLQPSHYSSYTTLASVVRHVVPNVFKDSGAFIFMGKLTFEDEEATVLQNSRNYTPNTVSHPSEPETSTTPLWKPPLAQLSSRNSTIISCSIQGNLKRQMLLIFNTQHLQNIQRFIPSVI